MQTEFSKLREQAGITIEKFADHAGFSVRTIYRWENGDTPPRRAALALLKNMIPHRAPNLATGRAHSPAFTFIDLFAGIGGLRRGFDRIGGKCVFTSEWNSYSQQTYKANFECDHDVAGDITQIAASEIPAHDLLLAGFPCQPFSIAGVSKKNALGRAHGFRCESQGTLFFDVARIIAHHRPKAFLLENVKNLVNHDKGKTFRVIQDTLKNDLGYHLQYRVIDAKCLVPQHRERIFIVGLREENTFDLSQLALPDSLAGPKLKSILHPENGSEPAESPYTTGPLGVVSEKYTLTDNLWQYLQGYAEKHRLAGNGFGFGLNSTNDVARTLSARYHKDGSEILIKQEGKNPRRLTPRECARLMGFDQLGLPPFCIPVSDTQAYKQFGNAVVASVGEAVARHMAPWLQQQPQPHSMTGQDRLELQEEF